MNIIDLINGVGVDNVKVQFLDIATDTVNWTAKKGTKVTFGTDVAINLADNKLEMLGVVVWLPREEAMALAKKDRGE
jgi:hypothetical protein